MFIMETAIINMKTYIYIHGDFIQNDIIQCSRDNTLDVKLTLRI